MDDLEWVCDFERKEIVIQIMELLSKFFSNARKPNSFLGKIMVR